MSPNTSPVNDEVQPAPTTSAQTESTADVVTRLLAEGLISAADAARLISDKQGRPVSACTIGRWADDGVRTTDGRVVRLEAIRLGGRLKTTAEAILARHGWDVRRSTLCDHLRKCGWLLTPLYDLMHQRLLRSFAIHADDTPLVLLRPHRTAFAWVYLGDEANPYTLFDLTPGRSQTFPQQFLAGYQGFVHADAYDGYNAVHGNVRHLGCWMHARRYFVDAEPTDPRAIEALAFIRTLYSVEKGLKDERARLGVRFTGDDAVRCRQTRAGPILSRFADWLGEQSRSATPKSLFGQAVGYARNQWPTLVRYVNDTRFAIDNGAAERAIRPIAIGRANWLQIGGDGGLPTASVLLSVCASARRNGHDPWAYLTDVLAELPTRAAGADLIDLLPDRWGRRPGGPVVGPG